MTDGYNFDAVVDACGLQCPLPLLKAKLALNSLNDGEYLQVLATDSGSERDFAVFAEQSGHTLLKNQQTDNYFEFVFQKNTIGK